MLVRRGKVTTGKFSVLTIVYQYLPLPDIFFSESDIHCTDSNGYGVINDVNSLFMVIVKLEKLKADAKAIDIIDVEAKERAESCNWLSQLVSDREVSGEDLLLKYESSKREAKQKASQSADRQRDELQQIDAMIRNLQSTDDDDTEIQENPLHTTTNSLRCPFTNGALTNPVKNSECKHVYSLEGVLSFLAQNAQIKIPSQNPSLDIIPAKWSARCPVAGCNFKIRRSQLKKDYQTELSQRQMAMSVKQESADVEDDVEQVY